MKRGKSIALVSVGLVAGLVLGSVGFAYAAPADTTPTNTVLASGLRMGQSIRDAGGRLVDVVAKLTGLSVEEVQAERADGKSAAEIAEANGVDSEKVVADALAIRKAALDAKVADGTITQEQADAAYARMTERVTERVSSNESGRADGGRGSGGRGMGAGGACGGTCVTAPVQ